MLDLKRAAAELRDLHKFPVEVSSITFDHLSSEVDPDRPTTSNPSLIKACDILFVRAMQAGSLEQIVFRMDVLQRLKREGLIIVNSPKAIEASVDKYLSLALMAQHGVSVPLIRVSQTVEMAVRHFHAFGNDVVVKPIFGSLGKGVQRLKDEPSATEYFEQAVEQGRVIYQQQFIDHEGWDLRLFVVGDSVFAMKRIAPDGFVTNIYRGGKGVSHVATALEIDIARRAMSAVGARIGGVDLVYQRQNDHPFVLEVNAAPGWKELQHVLQVDIARRILKELGQAAEGPVTP